MIDRSIRRAGSRLGVSEIYIVNALCCAIGPLLAYNGYYVYRYWGVIVSLYQEAARWLTIAQP